MGEGSDINKSPKRPFPVTIPYDYSVSRWRHHTSVWPTPVMDSRRKPIFSSLSSTRRGGSSTWYSELKRHRTQALLPHLGDFTESGMLLTALVPFHFLPQVVLNHAGDDDTSTCAGYSKATKLQRLPQMCDLGCVVSHANETVFLRARCPRRRLQLVTCHIYVRHTH